MIKIWGFMVGLFSFEWLLTRTRLTNGGEVILLRSLLATTMLYIITLSLKNYLDPTNKTIFSHSEFKRELVNTIPWFGAIFGSIYFALYTRFASQWRYLADLYNKIKETECKYPDIDKNSLSAWKAGFIEDAFELHLATKGLFASVIYSWSEDPAVRAAFIDATELSDTKYDALINRVAAAYEKHKRRWQG